jgi:peptidoglycan/xylan/chitin deacetylase (PgdA/CDA1 family)
MILLYHNLVPDNSKHGFKNHSLTLFESDFRKHVSYLNKIYDIIPLKNYLEYLTKNGRPKKRSVSITFDDGTYLTYECLSRVLLKTEINVTVFVSTCQIDKGPLIYGAHLNALCGDDIYHQLEFDGSTFSLNGNSNKIKSKLQIAQIIRDKNYDKGLLSDLYSRYPIPDSIIHFYEGMSSDQLAESSSNNNISIGSHSVNHFELDNLTIEEQEEELYSSKKTLEKITKEEIDTFAYPSGRYNLDTIKLLEKYRYNYALAVNPYKVDTRINYEIPRVGIYSKSILKLIAKLMVY